MPTVDNAVENVIDCKGFVAGIYVELKEQVSDFHAKFGFYPKLALIRVEGDEASRVYVENKRKLCEQLGIMSEVFEVPNGVAQPEIEAIILRLNRDKSVNGILLQLPLPGHLDSDYLTNLIDPQKDVDGLTLYNQGALAVGKNGLFPCTPAGVVALLKHVHGSISGKHAVVVGRSLIVGKPMSQLLLRENCSVTILHSKSEHASEISATADVLVAAVGKPRFITSDWVKNGATVVDIGINRIEVDGARKLVGDVDFEHVREKAGRITKVPGGVGPITVAFLMKNTLKAAFAQCENCDFFRGLKME